MVKTIEMDGEDHPECIYFNEGRCTHHKKGCWDKCSTMHLVPKDKDSCNARMYTIKEEPKMKLSGIYEEESSKNTNFFLRLVPSKSINGAVSIEAVNSNGDRISLLCRISTEKGIQCYSNVAKSLGFPLVGRNVIITGNSPTS